MNLKTLLFCEIKIYTKPKINERPNKEFAGFRPSRTRANEAFKKIGNMNNILDFIAKETLNGASTRLCLYYN